MPPLRAAAAEVEDTAGVVGDEDVGVGLGHARQLAGQDPGGDLGAQQGGRAAEAAAGLALAQGGGGGGRRGVHGGLDHVAGAEDVGALAEAVHRDPARGRRGRRAGCPAGAGGGEAVTDFVAGSEVFGVAGVGAELDQEVYHAIDSTGGASGTRRKRPFAAAGAVFERDAGGGEAVDVCFVGAAEVIGE